MYKVVVVDDHPFIRATVCMLLRKERLDVVGQADNGIDAVRLARELGPDLVILDIAMPGLDGLEVIARIKAMTQPPKVLVLTSQLPEAYSLRCMQAGAMGFVAKTDELDRLRHDESKTLGHFERTAEFGFMRSQSLALSISELRVGERFRHAINVPIRGGAERMERHVRRDRAAGRCRFIVVAHSIRVVAALQRLGAKINQR